MSTLPGQGTRRQPGSYLRMCIFRSWPREGGPSLPGSLLRPREPFLAGLNQGIVSMRPWWSWHPASSIILATFHELATSWHLLGYCVFPSDNELVGLRLHDLAATSSPP